VEAKQGSGSREAEEAARFSVPGCGRRRLRWRWRPWGREGCGGDWGRRQRLASHLTAARLGPRTSGASDVLWLRERDDDDETTGSREPGERAGTIEGRARGDRPCGKSPVRRGEERRGQRGCGDGGSVKTRGETSHKKKDERRDILLEDLGKR
jgi:hypothetical protein